MDYKSNFRKKAIAITLGLTAACFGGIAGNQAGSNLARRLNDPQDSQNISSPADGLANAIFDDFKYSLACTAGIGLLSYSVASGAVRKIK